MKRIIQTLMVVCLLLALTSQASAEALRILTVNLSPYGHLHGDEPSGVAYEIGNLIAEEAGYAPKNVIAPLGRIVSDLGSGNADVAIVLPNPEIEEVAFNLGTVVSVESIVIGRAGTPMRSLRDIKGKMVAAVRGTRYDERICECNGIVILPTANYSQSLKLLMASRVDGVVGPRFGIFHAARELRLPKRAFGEPLVLSTAKAGLYLSQKTRTAEKEGRLKKALGTLLKNGAIKSVFEKYSL